MCILGVLYIRAGPEPEGYNLSYSISLKNAFCFNLCKKRCSEASRLKVRSSSSFPNLEVPESFLITISTFFYNFVKHDVDVVYV